MTYEDFIKEYKNFNKVNNIAQFQPTEEYFNLVEKKHSDIRKLLGGTSKTFKINLSNINLEADLEDIRYILDDIEYAAPKYLKTYKLNDKDLINPYIGKIKTTKHITTYLNKNQKDVIDMSIAKQAVSDLGYELALNNNPKLGTWATTISTDIINFMNLGHYDCDKSKGSCYRSVNNEWYKARTDKIFVSTSKNSFVLLINKDKEPKDLLNSSIRMFGYLNKNHIYFTNLYYNLQHPSIIGVNVEGILKGIVLKLGSQIFNTDKIFFHKNISLSEDNTNEYIYINDGSYFAVGNSRRPTPMSFSYDEDDDMIFTGVDSSKDHDQDDDWL